LRAAAAQPDGDRLRLRRAFGKSPALLVEEASRPGQASDGLAKWPDERVEPFGARSTLN